MLLLKRGFITCTSSSLRMGIDLTLYFCLRSLDRGADMSLRLMCEGAVKCLFLFFLLEEVTKLLNFILLPRFHLQKKIHSALFSRSTCFHLTSKATLKIQNFPLPNPTPIFSLSSREFLKNVL